MTQTKYSMDDAVGKSERRISALAVSRGIGIGRIVFLHGEKRQFFRIELDESGAAAELKRFRSAVAESKKQLSELASSHRNDPNQPVAGIFGVHLTIIEESSLVEKVETVIRDHRVNTEWSLRVVADEYLERQRSLADSHFREKHLDIEDVCERFLTALNGSHSIELPTYSGAVIVAQELRPSTILELKKSNPAALIAERGGWTSHTSIIAREFELPMITGIKDLEKSFELGDHAIVDGINGHVIIHPTSETVERYAKLADSSRVPNDLPVDIDSRTTTLDGTNIAIRANVDIPEAHQLAKHFGAEGIGLFRSESLITSPGRIPTEDDQVLAYRQMAKIAGDEGVKIRTFDVGFDQLKENGRPSENNPALGLRSIRLSLHDPIHFRAQIRAILRASNGQRIDIVLPMVSGVSEIIGSKAIIAEESAKLKNQNIPIGLPNIGAMIEIPSGVLMAREIAQNVDFISIGTNDLVQYLLAADRDNDRVADWYQTLHPAVIRSISRVLSAASNENIPVIICGEMAGSTFYAPVLIGLGARELSMNVNSIHEIRRLISGITLSQTLEIVEEIQACVTAEEIEARLTNFYLANWANLFPPGLLESKHR